LLCASFEKEFDINISLKTFHCKVLAKTDEVQDEGGQSSFTVPIVKSYLYKTNKNLHYIKWATHGGGSVQMDGWGSG